MAFDPDLAPDAGDAAVAADQERRSLDAHIVAAIHRFLDPQLIGLDHLALLVGGEVDGEIVLGLEFVVFSTLSGDRPITTAPAFSNSGFSCEKLIASLVQLVVSSCG